MVITDFMKVKDILLKGIKKDTLPVISSYGPNAKGSLVRSSQGAMVYTRDGYTISQKVSPDYQEEEFGLRLAKSVTAAQQNNCGDGTSSALILFYLLSSSIFKRLEYGYSVQDIEEIKSSLFKDSDLLINYINSHNLNINGEDFIPSVSRSSMGNFTDDSLELANLIYETVKEVQSGSIEIELSHKDFSYKEINKGCQRVIDQCSKLLTQTLTKPYVYICDNMLNFAKLNDVFNRCIDEDRSILIISSQVDNSNLKQFESLVARGALKGNVVRVNLGQGYTEDFLNDMAYISNAKVDYLQKDDLTPIFDYLGELDEFKQEDTYYNFKPYDKVNLQDKITELDKIDTSDNRSLQWRVESRKNFLLGKVGTIYVNASTEEEFIEKKYKIMDSLASTRLAFKSGVSKSLHIISKGSINRKLSLISQEVFREFRDILKSSSFSVDPILTLTSIINIAYSMAIVYLDTSSLIFEEKKDLLKLVED